MSEYHVSWEIELSAESPENAAMEALCIQRDPLSMATVFDVHDEHGDYHRVDLVDHRRADYWEEDSEYPLQDWKYETMNDDTRLGYWQWVDSQRQKNE